jgi:hypothetical protein
MFSRWWPRLTVIWPKSTQLTGWLGLINPAENLGRHNLPSDVLRVTIMGILSSTVSLALGQDLSGSPSPHPIQSPRGEVRSLRSKVKHSRFEAINVSSPIYSNEAENPNTSTEQCPAETVIEPPKLTAYYHINHSFWSLRNNTELTCRLCRVKPCKSLVTKDRQPYVKTHTKASLEINKSQFITSIPMKGYLITNRVFCIKVNCSELINTAEIKLNDNK